ncbi:MAG TPA: hypothetical protein DDX39_10020 [Bacteroidales bacterium]|nr:MAG: hypothetical protein A2W98_01355 [Bacteroidetes bacterium GWF2_33_38]OFY75184.1 MAG: hypothetical protein A2265_05215 [Bacteroidetes bacterium RIFOXYA12_FULL_33_9]OFY88978.1 MAG: hypothetical protein A2236_04300 [Bacteroidetes bacterium RIFOXYA2_FULL_33_7]HBF88966.1 hypothetical protein [Bacteroidales bacterium]
MEEQATKKRPTFVTVLGILGFIGVGWQVISGIIQMMAGAVTGAVMDVAEQNVESLEGLEGMEGLENVEGMEEFGSAMEGVGNLMQHQSTLGLISIIAALVCLLGVIWMWNLKKKGFYVYIIGEIAPAIATLVLVGFGLGGFMATLGFIIPVVMIILWGLNLKHMS